jgi:hypothetical protein
LKRYQTYNIYLGGDNNKNNNGFVDISSVFNNFNNNNLQNLNINININQLEQKEQDSEKERLMGGGISKISCSQEKSFISIPYNERTFEENNSTKNDGISDNR